MSPNKDELSSPASDAFERETTTDLDDETADRHRAILASLGLPTTYDAAAWPALVDAMRVDKKSRGDRLRFVVLDGLAKPGILEAPDVQLLSAAYSTISRGEDVAT